MHTLAEIDAVELLGEVGYTSSTTPTCVGEWPPELATMKGEQMLKAMLYDTGLVVELLSLVKSARRAIA